MTLDIKDPGCARARAEKLGESLSNDVAYTRRRARRQDLCRHLTDAGPRPVYEAIIEIAAGGNLDEVLERYGRIPVHHYHALGASEFGGTR